MRLEAGVRADVPQISGDCELNRGLGRLVGALDQIVKVRRHSDVIHFVGDEQRLIVAIVAQILELCQYGRESIEFRPEFRQSALDFPQYRLAIGSRPVARSGDWRPRAEVALESVKLIEMKLPGWVLLSWLRPDCEQIGELGVSGRIVARADEAEQPARMDTAVVECSRCPIQVAGFPQHKPRQAVLGGRHHQAERIVPLLFDPRLGLAPVRVRGPSVHIERRGFLKHRPILT